jgi:hypothetical protein
MDAEGRLEPQSRALSKSRYRELQIGRNHGPSDCERAISSDSGALPRAGGCRAAVGTGTRAGELAFSDFNVEAVSGALLRGLQLRMDILKAHVN